MTPSSCLLLADTEFAQAEPVPAVPPLNTVQYTVDCTHMPELPGMIIFGHILPGMNIFINFDDLCF